MMKSVLFEIECFNFEELAFHHSSFRLHPSALLLQPVSYYTGKASLPRQSVNSM